MIKKLISLLSNNDKKNGLKTLIIFVFHAFVEVSGAAAIFPLLIVLIDNSQVSNNFVLNKIFTIFSELGLIRNTNQNIILIFTLLVLTIFILIIRAYSAYSRINFLESTRLSLSKRLLYSYLSQNYEFFIYKNANELAKNILAEVDEIVAKVLFPITNMVAQLIVGIALIMFLFIVNFKLAISLTIFTSFLYALFYSTFAKYLLNIGSIRRVNNKRRFISANELLMGIKSIKVKNGEILGDAEGKPIVFN